MTLKPVGRAGCRAFAWLFQPTLQPFHSASRSAWAPDAEGTRTSTGMYYTGGGVALACTILGGLGGRWHWHVLYPWGGGGHRHVLYRGGGGIGIGMYYTGGHWHALYRGALACTIPGGRGWHWHVLYRGWGALPCTILGGGALPSCPDLVIVGPGDHRGGEHEPPPPPLPRWGKGHPVVLHVEPGRIHRLIPVTPLDADLQRGGGGLEGCQCAAQEANQALGLAVWRHRPEQGWGRQAIRIRLSLEPPPWAGTPVRGREPELYLPLDHVVHRDPQCVVLCVVLYFFCCIHIFLLQPIVSWQGATFTHVAG